MKKFIILIFVALLIVAYSNCHSIDDEVLSRVKRSDDGGFFGKVKTGLVDFGTKTKKFFVKGYEETKNLFSSDRKVGDYTLGDIDVRFDGDEDEDGNNSTTVATRRKRESPKIVEGIKTAEDGFESADSEAIVEQQENEENKDSTDIFKYTIQTPPKRCKKGQIFAQGKCRTLAFE